MLKSRIESLLAGALLVTALSALPAQGAQPEGMATPSLYSRLGGYDAIAAVVDDFIGQLLGDADLGRFFTGHGQDSRLRIRQLIVDQLCAATGGPCVYIGRDMKTSHQGLGITEAQWTKSVGYLVKTLDKFKVGQTEKDELLAALTALKADIVEAP